MAVTYDKISFDKIEEKLRDVLNDEFNSVYIADKMKSQKGNESIRIHMESESTETAHPKFEDREYIIQVRYYYNEKPGINRNKYVRNRVDRLRKHLIDNQNITGGWYSLTVQGVIYDVIDEDNEERENLNITDLTISVLYYHQWS